MFRSLMFIAVSTLVVSTNLFAQVDLVEQKLVESKSQFDSTAEKARTALVESLQKKEASGKKTGNLQMLQTVQSELKAFEENGELPKSVPTGVFEGQMKRARARLEEAYADAVKQYTKAGSVELAKTVQQELDEFRKSKLTIASDPFLPKSVWMNEANNHILTVVERKGESFRALFQVGRNIERDVTGTINAGKVSWFAKDVRTIKGHAGGDNHGTLALDKVGYRIDFVWRDESGGTGNFTLRLATK
jgi:hypothetical protein